MNIIVGVADMQVTNDPGCTLVTYALGSCIGVTIYAPAVKIGGLLHFMLPESALDPQKAQKNPWMFADTGIPLFLGKLTSSGPKKKDAGKNCRGFPNYG